MGCDIHSYVEQKHGDYWDDIEFSPFRQRNYGAFAFLADVRNYSAVPPLAAPRGLPEDISFIVKCRSKDWEGDAHTHSWLSAKELLDFNYDAEMEDRRYTQQEGPNFFNGAATAEPGQGTRKTWRDFLGPAFMRDLEMLRAAGDAENTRVVFWFDN